MAETTNPSPCPKKEIQQILTLSWLRLQVHVPWSASLAAATSSLHSLLFPEKNYNDDFDIFSVFVGAF